ncbi:TPA: hypothetical protein N3288_000207 [Klebsiella aerogenes]|nr:hypothetical protein [Klebsiella aerogenes]
MKKIIVAAVLSLAAASAFAETTCSTDSFGNTRCYGTTQDGQSINTTTSTDSFGNTRTYGTVGGQTVQQTCSTDSFGNTRCY